MQYANDLLHRIAQFGFEFQIRQHEIDTKGDPNLGQHGVAYGTEEGGVLRVLLDPLKNRSICQRSL